MKRVCLTAMALLGLTAALSAQIMNGNAIPEEPAKPVTPGELSPYFWIGAQTMLVLGKNFETGASGFSYSPNQTWVSFDVSFLDSHWDTPKKIVSTDDPNAWTVSFKLYDPTARINNYSTDTEVNYPSWALGVQGFGWRFGYHYEYNQPLGLNQGSDTSNVPAANALYGANEVQYLGQLGVTHLQDVVKPGADYTTDSDGVVQVNYPVTGAAYASYSVPDLYTVSVTVGSQNADSASAAANNGYAGVVGFSLTPMGQGSYDEPLTYTVKGDLIAGTGYKTSQGNPLGFGLQGQADYYLDDDVFISPLVAFDGRFNDTSANATLSPDAYKFEWRAGGGMLLTLSPKRWVPDLYEELPLDQSTYKDAENAHIRKFTYVQAMVDYSRYSLATPNRDLNLILKAEEPDGIVGMDDNLGAMVEVRVSNLMKTNPGTETSWTSIGRVSYEFNQHTVMPYLQGYLDSTNLAQVRLGAQLELIPGTALEVAYMTANLTNKTSVPEDSGRLMVIFGLATDPAFRLIKTMNFSFHGDEP